MNIVEIKYNGKKNPKFIPRILILHVLNCSSDTNFKNTYPSKHIFGVSKCKYGDCPGLCL